MSDSLRNQIGDAAQDQLERIVPKQRRQDRAKVKAQREDYDQKYGRSRSFRISDNTFEMVGAAAKKHNVKKGNLVEFLLRAGLYQLESGRIELPIAKRDDRPRDIEMPDVP